MLTPINIYVGAAVLLAGAVLAGMDWSPMTALSGEALIGFGALAFLCFVSEVSSAYSYSVGPKGGKHSLIFIPLVAAVLLFGPAPAVLLALVSETTAEFLIRKKPWFRATFNSAQYVLATAVGAWLFVAAGGYPLAAGEVAAATFDVQIIPVVIFGGSLIVINHVAVAVAIALSERRQWLRVTRNLLNRIAGTVFSDLLVLPVAILVAYLYSALWVGGLFVAVLPLLFIRHSYLAKYRLEVANRDLLRVFVKAIETRDPYTSGHSMRVQAIAASIGDALGLSPRQSDELEAAALLHDIGKIEATYEEILRRPGALSEKERTLIQSHVDRGVELLTSLSSFHPRVIAGVRHHHELYDGSGYPDGLAGKAIPLYARIIKLSDAIDAMLSDRPYRRALSPARVHAELLDFKGRHFDPDLVTVVVSARIVDHHAAVLAVSKDRPSRPVPIPPSVLSRFPRIPEKSGTLGQYPSH